MKFTSLKHYNRIKFYLNKMLWKIHKIRLKKQVVLDLKKITSDFSLSRRSCSA